MKRPISIFVILTLLLGIIGCWNESLDFPVGKDTVKVAGNGKFQIGKFPDSLKLYMYDENNNIKIIVDEVKSYKKIKNSLYVIGDEGKTYSKIDGETNICKLYSTTIKKKLVGLENANLVYYLESFDEFTENEKEVFYSINK